MKFQSSLYPYLLGLLCATGLQLSHAQSTPAPTAPKPGESTAAAIAQTTTKPEYRSKVLLIQPVIVSEDDGSQPAAWALPKDAIDTAYTAADLEWIYLEPKHWNHSAAKNGKINLNEIVNLGRANGMIVRDPRVITMIFVRSVDGKLGPLGRGLFNGNVCFVAVPEPLRNDQQAMFRFVIAHEVGHCLGLRHAVDDPEVPDDQPNLQGDGPFEARIAATGLVASQAKTIQQSPRCLNRIHFHTQSETAQLLAHDDWFPYLETTADDAFRFGVNLPPATPIPTQATERLEFLRKQSAQCAAEFTPSEQAFLTQSILKLRHSLNDKWPLLQRLPWHFVKVNDGFSNNYAHTRGLAITFTAKTIARMQANEELALTLLFHEKIHVLQRLNPTRFNDLYHRYGYTPIRLADGEGIRMNLIQNPDAPEHDWAIQQPNGPVLLATQSSVRDGKIEFAESYFNLLKNPDGSYQIGKPLQDLTAVEKWRERFPIRIGYDHPHEVFAYLSTALYAQFRHQAPASAPQEMMQLTQKAMDSNFALVNDPQASSNAPATGAR